MRREKAHFQCVSQQKLINKLIHGIKLIKMMTNEIMFNKLYRKFAMAFNDNTLIYYSTDSFLNN